MRVEARVRKDKALVYANVGVHADVEITLALDRNGGEVAAIHFGHDGSDLILDLADLDSLERLAAVATDGTRQLRDRITANRTTATNTEPDRLVGAGVAR